MTLIDKIRNAIAVSILSAIYLGLLVLVRISAPPR